MNEEQNLILIKNEDKTAQIDSCNQLNGNWIVRYQNSNKDYTYKKYNITWYKNPKLINHKTCIVFENKFPLSGIVCILDFGHIVKIVFKTGYKKVYNRSNILIEQSCLSNLSAKSTFEYLKTIANEVSIKSEMEGSFLGKQYNKLTKVNANSVLGAYLEGKPLMSQSQFPQIIYPFGFNISQKSATEKALTEQVSVIEGPPGTGKTQTILNIIANAIMNNKTVAVVSNNNSATANILEKLEKYGVGFFAAYLGNKENKEKFFSEQKSTYPDMVEWSMLTAEFQSISNMLKTSQKKLNEMLKFQNKCAIFKQELSKLKTEFGYFMQYYHEFKDIKSINFNSLMNFSSDKVLKFLLEYKRKQEHGKFSFKDKIQNIFLYGIFNFKFYKNPPEVLISFLQKTYYEKKIIEITDQIKSLSNKLENYDFENEMKEYSRFSIDLFKAKLADKYRGGGNRTVFTDVALRRGFRNFINEYPVILSTTHSLRNSVEQDYMFDYVIIDEASQVDLVAGALALSCAKNAVIVGDIKQLPNVVPPEIAKTTSNLFASYGLHSAYNYAEQSILTSFLELFKNIPKTLLKEHYRCHPKIIGFCNQKFYNNELIVLTNERDSDKPLIVYKTAKGNHARGKINQRQIDVVLEEIIPEQIINSGNQSVGVISPFRLQANEFQKVVGNGKIDADTVHKYQGRERDIIILSTVANEIGVNDFADDSNLINVAVSRAVNQLIVVVSEGSEEWKGTNIGDLIKYIQYNNFEVIESQIYSVFDLLYKNYSNKLLEMIKKNKNVSDYKSENLMNAIIEKVLSHPEFQSLDWVLHQPLRMLIKDPIKLTEVERKYAMNILTHTDFVIFNKLDKIPVLVVEVDGHAYHANNPLQLKRDKMKDNILQKYNIPILRMKTTESREEKRLRQKLEEILKLDSNRKQKSEGQQSELINV